MTLHRKTRKAPQFPRGTTFATISQKLLPRLFHMPSTLKNLVITSVYTDYKNLRFPEGLRSLSIQNKGDPSSVHSWMFPSSLRVLKVWEMPCDTKLPDSIFSLTVMDSMISPPNPVKYTLPCMLTFLDLGPWSDVSPLDFDMPDTLQVLLLPYFFNESLKNWKFPAGLKTLVFGSRFNRNVKHWKLPGSLECLMFGREFDQDLTGWWFPKSLKWLRIGSGFRKDLSGLKLSSKLLVLEVLNPKLSIPDIPAETLVLCYPNICDATKYGRVITRQMRKCTSMSCPVEPELQPLYRKLMSPKPWRLLCA